MDPLPTVDVALGKLARHGIQLPAGVPVGVGGFGDSPGLSEELLALIVSGRKRAGTSLLWAHEADGEPLPEVGRLEIVVDHLGEPALVTRALWVEVTPFDAVTAAYAAVEGEGDGSLAYWQEGHRAFFGRECARIGREASPSMPVVCCIFELLHVVPRPPSAGAVGAQPATSPDDLPAPADVLAFWFEELRPAQWWRADPVLDETIRRRFGALHRAAVAAELAAWRDTPEGRLAEILVLDQFSRNVHRGTPLAFAADPMALALAQEAVRGGADLALPPQRRAFVYLPYMHSESRAVHVQAEWLFRHRAPDDNLQAELQHKAIVDRFGRYPHRNVVLGRVSTEEEEAFLRQPGSAF